MFSRWSGIRNTYLVEQDKDTDWWLEESWKIKSIKESWGKEINILFLVDPQYDDIVKSKVVWAVMAAEEMPTEKPLDEGISQMALSKGKYENNLNDFVEKINKFRSENSL